MLGEQRASSGRAAGETLLPMNRSTECGCNRPDNSSSQLVASARLHRQRGYAAFHFHYLHFRCSVISSLFISSHYYSPFIHDLASTAYSPADIAGSVLVLREYLLRLWMPTHYSLKLKTKTSTTHLANIPQSCSGSLRFCSPLSSYSPLAFTLAQR